jgi:ubiquinone/menaquinone biosynthesis C-methylase UbiE
MKSSAKFWDGLAVKYAAQPIANMDAYEQTLERVVSYLRPDARVLELGCGTGGTALRLAPHVANMLATDYSGGMITQARARDGAENVTFLQADTFSPELEKGGYDVVMGFNLFHLMQDPEAAMTRIHDLLLPGGLFISKTPCLGGNGLGLKMSVIKVLLPLAQWVGKAPFVRFDSISEFEEMVLRSGFSIIETGSYPARPPSRLIVAERV